MAKRKSKRQQPLRDDSSVLEIDEHNLEKEWAEHSQIYYRFALELADAKTKLDEAKAQLDLVKAELDTQIRADPEKYNIERISEAAINNAILQQPIYKLEHKAYLKANEAVRVLEAMTRALEHRKRALQSMVELYLSNYYAEPRLPEGSQEAYEQQAHKARVRRRRKRIKDQES